MLAVTTAIFDKLLEAYRSKKYNVYVLEGGSRSSKTWSICQFWLNWANENRGKENIIVVSRLKGTWIKGTVLMTFLKVLKKYNQYSRKNFNKSEGAGIYTLYTTQFWFLGLDDEQRLHGMETDAFWINEAIEGSKDDYDQLMQRCNGFAILDYNPSEEEHWIYDNICKRPKSYYSHSTMLDNRLISKNAKEQILSYEPTEENYKSGTVDKRKWEIYGLGKRAKIEGLVFDGFDLINEIPNYITKRFTGLDFGYTNDPTAGGEVAIDGNTLYIDELFYQTRMSVSDIVNKLKQVNNGRKIISESADPRLVDEIYNAGFNIHAVEKGKGSVEAGLEKMKTMRIVITTRSINAIKEFKNYTYQQDKNGKWLNVPVDNMNHIIDFVRYVVLMEVLGRNYKTSNIRSNLARLI
jgi:phage terminase large subunit